MEPEQWNVDLFEKEACQIGCTADHKKLKRSGRTYLISFYIPAMLSATEVNTLVNFKFVTPANNDSTPMQDLVST